MSPVTSVNARETSIAHFEAMPGLEVCIGLDLPVETSQRCRCVNITRRHPATTLSLYGTQPRPRSKQDSSLSFSFCVFGKEGASRLKRNPGTSGRTRVRSIPSDGRACRSRHRCVPMHRSEFWRAARDSVRTAQYLDDEHEKWHCPLLHHAHGGIRVACPKTGTWA